ncbi:MAG: ROK family protein [Actinophytocola sp.]|nr:ROK family protein [Actinophytocola sp.]
MAARPASMRTNPGVMRELNRGLLLDIAKREGPLSRADLAKSSQLAKPTVSAIVEGLLEDGLLREIGTGPTSGGGRHPILLEFNPRSQFVVGVHVGARAITAVLADGVGEEIGRTRLDTPAGSPHAVLTAVTEAADALIRRARVARKRVVGLGIGIPGQVETRSGVCYAAPQLGWQDVAVADELRDTLKLPVFVRNVAQCVVLAEHRHGAATDADSAVVFLEDQGIAAALLTDGTLFHGTQGIAGDVGHIRLHGVTTECSCGGRGCLEAIASGAGLARRAAEATGTEYPADDVFAGLADDDDPGITELLAKVGQELGIAASWLLNLYNPDVLVVAGGFLDAGEALLAPLRETALECASGQVGATVRVRTGALGADAPALGAVLVALNEAERTSRA